MFYAARTMAEALDIRFAAILEAHKLIRFKRES